MADYEITKDVAVVYKARATKRSSWAMATIREWNVTPITLAGGGA